MIIEKKYLRFNSEGTAQFLCCMHATVEREPGHDLMKATSEAWYFEGAKESI